MTAIGAIALSAGPAVSTLGRGAEKVGIAAAAVLAAFVVLSASAPRGRAWRPHAMLGVLVLTPVLLLANIWHSPQLRPLRDHPAAGVGAVVLGALIVVALAVILHRRRELVAPLAVAALPFRIPIASGATTSNLLVPLYLVIGAAALAELVSATRRARAGLRGAPADALAAKAGGAVPGGALEFLLMGLVVLYAVQASYSSDFSKALSQVVFFYVPFALLFALLRELRWDRDLLLRCLAVAVGLAVIFVAIGFVEYSRRQLLLNPKVVASNEVSTYFRVNSLFFDPNIYGRFLVMVMISLSALLLWTRRRRSVLGLAALLALLWAGLLVSFSQSSIAALLFGLAVLAALRWRMRWVVAAGALALVVGVAVVVVSPRAVRFDVGNPQAANRATNGRYHLIKAGLELFGERPLEGYGSASFVREYRSRRHFSQAGATAASHTIPLTVAAEQGLVGLAVYLALLAAAFARLFGAARRSVAATAIAAAFGALIVHTLLYASFLEDPITWTLLGVGTALAAQDRWRRPTGGPRDASHDEAPATA